MKLLPLLPTSRLPCQQSMVCPQTSQSSSRYNLRFLFNLPTSGMQVGQFPSQLVKLYPYQLFLSFNKYVLSHHYVAGPALNPGNTVLRKTGHSLPLVELTFLCARPPQRDCKFHNRNLVSLVLNPSIGWKFTHF